jgi:hypothetical protein
MHRDLALLPVTTGLVASVDLIHRRGPTMLAHVEPLLANFLRFFDSFFPSSLVRRERGERIGLAVQWVREYLLEGTLPKLNGELPEVQILDLGSNSFVLAETKVPSIEAWEVLFRSGYLRGVLLGVLEGDTRKVWAARKHERSWPHLGQTITFLNDLESLSGGLPEWTFEGDFVKSPSVGSRILVSHIMEVFLRI